MASFAFTFWGNTFQLAKAADDSWPVGCRHTTPHTPPHDKHHITPRHTDIPFTSEQIAKWATSDFNSIGFLVKVSFPLGTKVVVTFKGEPLRIELDCTTSASHDFGKFPRSPVLYLAFNADKHPVIAALKTVLGPKLIRALQVPNSPAHTALVEAIKGTKDFAGLEPAAVAACIAEAVDGLSVDARFRNDEYYGSTMMLALSPPHPRELHLGPKLDLAKLTPSGDLEAILHDLTRNYCS